MHAATPSEAIRLTHEYRGRIDLLMTDVVMPEMNGRDLAKIRLPSYPDMQRLFLSDYAAASSPPTACWTKACTPRRKLREVLEG